MGIQNVDVSADGALTVTLTNGTVLNLGNIKGADGLGITKAEINTSGELVLTYSNGDVKNLGKVSGENGKDGANGADGLGIKSLTLSPDGELVVTMSDNSISNLGNIKGDKGDRGEQGQQGLQGTKGADGRGIAKTELVNGELVITYTDGTSDNLGSISGTGDGIDGLAYYLLSDGTYAVSGGTTTYMTDIVIPDTHNGKPVTEILPEAFKQYSNLKSVRLPETINTIGQDAFYRCTSLSTINLPSSLKIIGKDAFYWCTSLSTINLPSSLETIGYGAFRGCSKIKTITIPASVKTINAGAFARTGLTDVYFEDTTYKWKKTLYRHDPSKGSYTQYNNDSYFSYTTSAKAAEELTYYQEPVGVNYEYYCYSFTRE